MPIELKQKQIKIISNFLIDTFTTEVELDQWTQTNEDQIGVGNTLKLVTGNEPKGIRFHEYALYLNGKRRLDNLVKTLNSDDRLPTETLDGIVEWIDAFVEEKDGNLVISKNLFDKVMLKGEMFPFINRQNVRDTLYRIFATEDQGQIIKFNGETKCGLSHTKWYLSELLNQYRIFQFVPIDFKRLQDSQNPEMLGAVEVAKALANGVGMEYTFSDEDFKNTFSAPFGRFLTESEKTYLFFLDHLDYINKPGRQFISDLSEDLLLRNIDFYLILCGTNRCVDSLDDFNDHILFSDEIVFEPFTKDHLKSYFEAIYSYLGTQFDLSSVTKAEFVGLGMDSITDEDLSHEHNVYEIGNKVHRWYRNFKTQIAS